MADEIIEVWVNCPDAEIARKIADAAIETRLAACANLHPSVVSRYVWKGAIEEEGEVPVTLKTKATLFDALAARVRAIHPFETPSIIAVPITAATADYADWVRAETIEPEETP